MSFLTAEWRKLAIANYELDPQLLDKYLPANTELNLWNNTCYVSLVGFIFVNTRVLGVSIPFHKDFEEVNLRFYVRYNDHGSYKRGVVFIKEIVPRPALTFVANTIYKEHYQTMKMRHEWIENDNERNVGYFWKYRGKENSIKVIADKNPSSIIPDSETEFITEHYWGYTRINSATTYEYEVTHPKWQSYKIKGYDINVDFAEIYGSEFGILNGQNPKSVMLAEGSEITVESKSRIT